MNDNYLAHYGVQGMKWGRRKTKYDMKKVKRTARNIGKKIADGYSSHLKKKYDVKNVKSISNWDIIGSASKDIIAGRALRFSGTMLSNSGYKKIGELLNTVGKIQQESASFTALVETGALYVAKGYKI